MHLTRAAKYAAVVIGLAALLCIVPSQNDKILQRDMTDEWKGWMQIVFILCVPRRSRRAVSAPCTQFYCAFTQCERHVRATCPTASFSTIDLMTLTSPHYHRYHYFAAKETYNIIRNLIAGYVFLTGFGNYSFFYIKGDFGFKRVIKMLFRLNFLVAMIAITLNKRYAPGALSRRLPIHVISPHLYLSYMLYYICALHTWWFLVVYGTMAIYGSYNQNNTVAAIKFGLLFLFITFLYDVRPDTPHTHTCTHTQCAHVFMLSRAHRKFRGDCSLLHA